MAAPSGDPCTLETIYDTAEFRMYCMKVRRRCTFLASFEGSLHLCPGRRCCGLMLYVYTHELLGERAGPAEHGWLRLQLAAEPPLRPVLLAAAWLPSISAQPRPAV